MKKTLMTLMSLVTLSTLLIFTSCNKEEAGDSQFTATMESCTDVQGKTVLNGTNLNWVSGDQIAIYGTGGNGIYSATPQAPATTAAFTRVSGNSVSVPCRAYYPATLTTDGMNITLPATQTYVAGSIQEFPMYAESNTNTLAFRNLCGALKLHLTKANTSISSIAVTAATPINGTFTVNYNNGDPVLTPVSSSATSVTGTTTMLTCATAQAIDNGADFFIYLPAGSYTGLEIELNTDDSRYCIKTANTTIPVTRSQYTTITLGENDLSFVNSLPQGALPGLFTINEDGDQVRFSQGNLQYQASTQTWRFAEHQWDYVGTHTPSSLNPYGIYGGTINGSDNSNIGSTAYGGWIDLFGWGTGSNPTLSSGYGYYQTFVDWGSNAISNGGNQTNTWYTLSRDEWNYVMFNRVDADTKRGIGSVNGVHGQILLPDSWTLPDECTFTAGYSDIYWNWPYNNYTLSQWAAMEINGAIFLPAAGRRIGTNVERVNYDGFYWSSTSVNDGYELNSYALCFVSNNCYINEYNNRHMGQAVRLVMDND